MEVEPSLPACQQLVAVLGLGLGSTAKLASFKVGRVGAEDEAELDAESGSTANLARRIPTGWPFPLLLPATWGLFKENGWTVATFLGRTPCSMTLSRTPSITVLAASLPEPTEASSSPRSGNSVVSVLSESKNDSKGRSIGSSS